MGEKKGTISDHKPIIFKLRREGWTTPDIGAVIGYEESTVRRLLLQETDAPLLLGRAQSRRMLKKHEEVYDYLDQGLGDAEIARRMQLEGDGYTRQRIIQLRRKREEQS